MALHNELGKKGEVLAVEYLIGEGYEIVDKNYRFQKAEVDIIVKKEDILVAIEVKYRSSNYFGNPQDFINYKKIKLLVSAMDNFLIERDITIDIRFDIIGITKQKNGVKINHIKDAFLYF